VRSRVDVGRCSSRNEPFGSLAPAEALIDATPTVAAVVYAKRGDAFMHNLAGRMGRPPEITLPARGRGMKFADDRRRRAPADRHIKRRPRQRRYEIRRRRAAARGGDNEPTT